MKAIICFIFLIGLINCFAVMGAKADEWGVMTNGAEISIKLENDKAPIKLGDPLILSIAIKNCVTNESFWGYYGFNGNRDYTYDVFFKIESASGEDISPDPKAYPSSFSGTGFIVPAGRTSRFRYDLSLLQKLVGENYFDKPGVYKVTAIQNLLCQETQKRFSIVSNALYFCVVSGKQ